MIKTDFGRVVVSIILGLGLASLFRKTCSELGCFNFVSPGLQDVEENVYAHGDTCVKFKAKTLACPEKTVGYA
jgi:hypothetical protein